MANGEEVKYHDTDRMRLLMSTVVRDWINCQGDFMVKLLAIPDITVRRAIDAEMLHRRIQSHGVATADDQAGIDRLETAAKFVEGDPGRMLARISVRDMDEPPGGGFGIRDALRAGTIVELPS